MATATRSRTSSFQLCVPLVGEYRPQRLDVVGAQFGPLLFAVVLTHTGGANTGGSGSERGSVSSIFEMFVERRNKY